MAHEVKANEAAVERAKAQAFFADLAAGMRRPSFGDMQKDWLRSLLTRAIEAKLYDPNLENT